MGICATYSPDFSHEHSTSFFLLECPALIYSPKGPGAKNSILVSQMSGRDPAVGSILCYLRQSALAGSWTRTWNQDLNQAIPVGQAGILSCALTAASNVQMGLFFNACCLEFFLPSFLLFLLLPVRARFKACQ